MKRVLIVGGSGGLGKQVAVQMRNIPDRDNRTVAYGVIAASSKEYDIASYDQRFIENNAFDIIINFAGVNLDGFIHKTHLNEAINPISVNAAGAYNLANACLPGMRQRGYGRIIMISSILSTHNVLGTGVYAATKAFVDRLVKSISQENISKGITANSIQLGYFDGGMTYKLPDPEAVKVQIPLKRFGRIDELVNAIEFLINTEYCTGINLPLTGGF
jgi:NAD(P)-dependent dehydrogenase (short-subunit alcohol dehydrogenase family)